jgi:PTH1 family peptidyl-tRNA hydrolase
MTPGPALVVGLGNPGPDYAETRHNVGFRVVELLAARAGGGRFSRHRTNADVLEARLAGRRVVLAKPRTYMNVSGGPVAGLAKYFSVPIEDLVVVHDDLDLGFGVVRLKRGGGEGGHNGLRSISSAVGTKDYLRVRFGIGRPPGRQDPADFVLKRFSGTEKKELEFAVDLAADAAEALLTDGLEPAQSKSPRPLGLTVASLINGCGRATVPRAAVGPETVIMRRARIIHRGTSDHDQRMGTRSRVLTGCSARNDDHGAAAAPPGTWPPTAAQRSGQ